MAKIWHVYEGREPTRGGPWCTMSLADCQKELGMKQSNFACDLTKGPRFGDQDSTISMFKEPRYVVIQLDEDEASAHNWKPGYYTTDVTPQEMYRRYPQAS